MARADAHPSTPLIPDDDSPVRNFRLTDVILLDQGTQGRGAPPDEWCSAAKAERLFHWKGIAGPDCSRLARIMAGRSIGVVMSGGGARAYAHIGAVRALREAGCPFDFVGGASMGAVIGACLASGWSDTEIDTRIRKAFVESNPLSDYSIPIIGLVKGKNVDVRLEQHFGDTTIESLKIPFFAVSTNLSNSAVRIHNKGVLRHALRASISLPGILPPVIDDGDVLVDGAVLNNFPVDIMRNLHRGGIVGIDVAQVPEGLDPEDFINPSSALQWILKNGVSTPPPIASLLMRTATINTNPSEGRELVDLLVTPTLEDVELRNWRAYDKVVEAGYTATKKALNEMSGPISRLIIQS
jgi:NTE family protein